MLKLISQQELNHTFQLLRKLHCQQEKHPLDDLVQLMLHELNRNLL